MYAFDIHIHTSTYSNCSFIHPEELIQQAALAGLDGLAITEHGIRWPDNRFTKLQQLAEPYGIVLINGQEIYTAGHKDRMEGEFLVFGVRKSLMGNYTARELVDMVHAEGGILIAAHPYRPSRGGNNHYYGAGDRIYELGVDALEHYHPDHDEQALRKIRKAMDTLGIPGTGGSDAHEIFAVGSCVTLFKNRIANEDEFIREIRYGTVSAEKRR